MEREQRLEVGGLAWGHAEGAGRVKWNPVNMRLNAATYGCESWDRWPRCRGVVAYPSKVGSGPACRGEEQRSWWRVGNFQGNGCEWICVF